MEETLNSPVEEINKELKELYNVVSEKISLSIADGQFTTESLDIILLKVVETIEELATAKNTKLSGTEKRNIAINLVRMVLKDLRNKEKIDEHLYASLTLSLTYLAPALFYAAKQSYKKLYEVSEDISKNGCKGCFGRNMKK